MVEGDLVEEWLSALGLDDPGCMLLPDPSWIDRPSLFEMQLADALDLGYEIAVGKMRRNESLPQLITRTIAHMVEGVTNQELMCLLFNGSPGGKAKTQGKEDTRTARNFRNEERPLKLETAARHILEMLYDGKVSSSEGGRLWYWRWYTQAASKSLTITLKTMAPWAAPNSTRKILLSSPRRWAIRCALGRLAAQTSHAARRARRTAAST